MKQLCVGVFGLGFGRRHIEAYQRLPGVRVVAIVARDAARREQAAQEFGIPHTYADYGQALAEEDLDLVSICTPDRLHARQALDALRAGVHVLCEKPIATTLEDAGALVRAARETDLVYAAGHNYRFIPQFARLKAMVDEGVVGDLLLGESSYVQDLYDMEGLGPDYWRFADPQDFVLGGAIHNVDLLRWVVGEIREVHAYSTRGMPFYPLDDTYVSHFTFENACIGRLLLVLGARLKEKLRFDLTVYGREGALRAALGRSEVVQDIDRPEVGAHGRAPVQAEGRAPVQAEGRVPLQAEGRAPLPEADSLALEIAHVIKCVRTGQQPLVDVVEGAKGVAVCLAAIRSAREGRPVTVDYNLL